MQFVTPTIIDAIHIHVLWRFKRKLNLKKVWLKKMVVQTSNWFFLFPNLFTNHQRGQVTSALETLPTKALQKTCIYKITFRKILQKFQKLQHKAQMFLMIIGMLLDYQPWVNTLHCFSLLLTHRGHHPILCRKIIMSQALWNLSLPYCNNVL